MRRAFIWLAGGDDVILRNCTNMHRSEQIRLTCLGALTVVPAVLGTCAMAYAISTLTDEAYLYVGGGVLWGLIVLAVDRYLVATMHKSEVRRRGGLVVSMLARLIFAIFIGIAVAHPLVLLWFDKTITQTIDENRRTAISERTAQAERDVAALPPAQLASTDLVEQRAQRQEYKECLVKLQTYEQSNLQSEETTCGVSSGSAGCGPRCALIGDRIDEVTKEIEVLDQQIAAAQGADGKAGDARQGEVDVILDQRDADLAAIEKTFSTDYLARVNALDQLMEKNPHVKWVQFFLILLFVLVDLVPLVMKMATPAGEYEHIRDTALLKSLATEGAKQRVAREGVAELQLARMQEQADATVTEMQMITRTPVQMLDEWEKHRRRVEMRIREMRANAEPGTELAIEAKIVAYRNLEQQAWDTAMARTMAFVSGPGHVKL
ncbi:DUF4407 domain-containing protein [Actinoplanes awajinensis]|uniref:DUF4407 domain-containing protein n=1 Tax=Actinoplanes awajinensis subsp. mycoplanecinus TaxID=135947 RepID=A0A0X3UQU2_9ACTN|nr:DUF4407 domain-containing protein [Actinoplanes awajinensis]KUL34497.1 hypothetical protein ADL15_15555 [Actinoplanes awajinensis subsp. mycoplanecinus]